jgi:hypothetical protein
VDHQRDAQSDDGCEQYQKHLEADPQEQAESTDIHLTGLALQEVEACRVLAFEE